jgi:sec-independent protein translocase protein TatC
MPRIPDEEDLFKESTMTFGQHLEELRGCLFKAILGLAIGCVLGLIVGGPVARFIQSPLQAALEDYYQNQEINKLFNDAELGELAKAGYDSPERLERLRKILRAQIHEKQPMSLEIVYRDKTGPAASGENEDLSLEPEVRFRRLAEGARTQLESFGAQESFMIYLKVSFLVGAVAASPWIFYQIWSFVAAGLYPHEKRYVHVFLPASVALFLTGMATAFFFVFKPVLQFLLTFNSMLAIDPRPRISEWMGFVLMVPLAFGIGFQLPLAMLFLERIGIFNVQAYLSYWRVAVLSIFVIALIILPSGDIYSLLILGGAMTVLYFAGVLLCHFLPRRRSAFDE